MSSIWYGLAKSLAYPSGEGGEGVISSSLHVEEGGGGGVCALWFNPRKFRKKDENRVILFRSQYWSSKFAQTANISGTFRKKTSINFNSTFSGLRQPTERWPDPGPGFPLLQPDGVQLLLQLPAHGAAGRHGLLPRLPGAGVYAAGPPRGQLVLRGQRGGGGETSAQGHDAVCYATGSGDKAILGMVIQSLNAKGTSENVRGTGG